MARRSSSAAAAPEPAEKVVRAFKCMHCTKVNKIRLPGPAAGPSFKLERGIFWKMCKQAEKKPAVLIVDVQDQSYEVAANLLGVPIGTVRSRLSRGRRLMQERLWAFAIDAGLGTGGQGLARRVVQTLAEAS